MHRDKSAAHEHLARELFNESNNITIEGFCARMQQKFPDLSDTGQLEHYYRQAKANQDLTADVRKVKDLCREIFDKCDHILDQTMTERA